MLKPYLKQLALKQHLSQEDAKAAAARLPIADPIEAAVFLTLFHAKGYTPEELVGFVLAFRQMAKTFTLDRPIVDIVGTGGDNAGTVNISTASALLAAAAGIPVVKHGNRAATSLSGSADLMEAFGASLDIKPAQVQHLLRQTQFAFCFAPNFHPALKDLRDIRKKMSIPTLFNLIGPLLHPANADHLVLGVHSEELVPTLARTLQLLGTKRSLLFSNDGLDELTCIGPSTALLVTPSSIEPIHIDPHALGLAPCTLQDLKGGSPETNRRLLRHALSGAPSSLTDTLILNAAAALTLYSPAKSLKEAVAIVREALESGAALRVLESYCQGSVLDPLKGKPFRIPVIKKSLKQALKREGVAVIAEIKRASPSKGIIAEIPDAGERAQLYVEQGASAISVLTNAAFRGSMDDLRAVVGMSVPVLRKDFIRTAEQVIQTAEAGADALLLIVSVLKERTGEMLKLARKLGMEALVEVHTGEEMEIAIAAGAEIIGVNQRDLSDFSMHPEKFRELAPLIPEECVCVAESGISSIEEASLLGYDAVLIGEALSRSEGGILCPR